MTPHFDHRQSVLTKIEHVIEETILSISQGGEALTTGLLRNCSDILVAVSFPSSSFHSRNTLARLLYILKVAHSAITSGAVVTKRSIYYEMPTLFTSQKQVDEIVDRVSRTLRVNRSDLGIVAAGKGLASGALAVQTTAGSTVDFSQNAKGSFVVQPTLIRRAGLHSLRYVLVIEKEATFRTLAADRFWKTASVAPGLLVTGKGYPDLSTRCFLRWIHNIRPDIPMLALTDFDPDGARIFFCYKSGSKTLSHETSATLPNLQWLGIREQHLQALTSSSEDNDPSSNSRTRQSQLLSMSTRDRCCAACMLVKLSNSAHTDAQALEYMSQIQMMLMLGVKAEIQMLNENGSIATWLDDQLVQYFRESCN